jgi:hypothetical protein
VCVCASLLIDAVLRLDVSLSVALHLAMYPEDLAAPVRVLFQHQEVSIMWNDGGRPDATVLIGECQVAPSEYHLAAECADTDAPWLPSVCRG